MAMILHGGRRSPYVRRIALWCLLQGRPVERRMPDLFGPGWQSFARTNRLLRVPVLELEDGERLIETSAILDHLEESAEPGRRLLPSSGRPRRDALQIMAIANGICEKGVALVYETERRPAETRWDGWVDRLITQIEGGFEELAARLPESGRFGSEGLDGADLSAVCAIDFLDGLATYSPAVPSTLLALAARANEDPAIAATHPRAA